MSISKRSLIFVFAFITAISFFGHDRQVVAQNFEAEDMPDAFYLTPRPYKPTGELKGRRKESLPECADGVGQRGKESCGELGD